MMAAEALTSVGADDEACVVWQMACQAISRGLEISLMPCQVHQCDNLAGACDVVSAGMRAKQGIVEDTTPGIQLHVHTSQSHQRPFA